MWHYHCTPDEPRGQGSRKWQPTDPVKQKAPASRRYLAPVRDKGHHRRDQAPQRRPPRRGPRNTPTPALRRRPAIMGRSRTGMGPRTPHFISSRPLHCDRPLTPARAAGSNASHAPVMCTGVRIRCGLPWLTGSFPLWWLPRFETGPPAAGSVPRVACTAGACHDFECPGPWNARISRA